MTDKISAPRYALRGLQLIGWRDMQHALDFLFADGKMKSGHAGGHQRGKNAGG